MTLEEFIGALDRYGPDLAHWPAALAETARTRLAADDAFRMAHEDAKALDALIGEAMAVPPVPFGYATRITARVLEAGRGQTQRFSRWLTVALGGWAVVACAAGVVSANLMSGYDAGAVRLAEVALGASSLVIGN